MISFAYRQDGTFTIGWCGLRPPGTVSVTIEGPAGSSGKKRAWSLQDVDRGLALPVRKALEKAEAVLWPVLVMTLDTI